LTWRVDGVVIGTGHQQIVTGLAPGEHTVQLTAQDSDGQSATAEQNVTILPLTLPTTNAPSLDGYCDDSSYAAGTEVQLHAYGSGAQATVQLLRSGNYLFACFQNMAKGATTPGAFAGVRVDKNNSRDALAQSDDYGFFVGEDGGQFTYAGDGVGGMAVTGPGGLVAQISSGSATWAAELRIDVAAVLDGWDHPVSLNLGHYWVNNQGDDYLWPRGSVWNAPNTWATTALGNTPQITALTPSTITAGSGAVTLVISGTNFTDGATAQWDGVDLGTTFGSSTVVSATVPAAETTTPNIVAVTVRSAGGLTSAPVPLPVVAPAPVVTTIGPDHVAAGAGATSVTVNGSGYLNGATVLWNGEPVPTTFGNSGQLTAQIPAGQLVVGGVAGIAVRNPDVDGTMSNSVPFTIEANASGGSFELYLPVVQR
ncbi:MAG TPA: IPT/TIG domain-containing protein, partial [Caldilineaceae bacterium]|nr:IPT/TIG domain-containing protein [Caldilineaceae bacterium]